MNAKVLRPLVVAAALALTGSSGSPAFADNTANTYHQTAYAPMQPKSGEAPPAPAAPRLP
jgi:hypothetical protein